MMMMMMIMMMIMVMIMMMIMVMIMVMMMIMTIVPTANSCRTGSCGNVYVFVDYNGYVVVTLNEGTSVRYC